MRREKKRTIKRREKERKRRERKQKEMESMGESDDMAATESVQHSDSTT